MVAPAKDAVGCAECHSRGGRLEKVDGIYIPGRDRNATVDLLGWLAAGLALAGVLVHGTLRIVRRNG